MDRRGTFPIWDWMLVMGSIGLIVIISVVLFMLTDVHEHDAIVLVAVVGAAASLANTFLIRSNRAKLEREMDTGNGARLGELVAANAERIARGADQIDAIEVQVRETRADLAEYVDKDQAEMRAIGNMMQEHIDRTAPVVAFVENLMPKEGGK